MIITYEFKSGDGAHVEARVVVDEGEKLERLVARLARRARDSKSQTASAAHGVIRVAVKVGT